MLAIGILIGAAVVGTFLFGAGAAADIVNNAGNASTESINNVSTSSDPGTLVDFGTYLTRSISQAIVGEDVSTYNMDGSVRARSGGVLGFIQYIFSNSGTFGTILLVLLVLYILVSIMKR